VATPVPDLDPHLERSLAAGLFNHVWTLLEKPDRTLAEDEDMVHAAHASRHHWGKVGLPDNLAVGEWQISRVYAVLGRAEPALHHAERSLAICEEHGRGDVALAYAYEALARAHGLAGRWDDVERYRAFAEEAGVAIEEDEDRELLRSDLATLPARPV
jgi:hypothetical protein